MTQEMCSGNHFLIFILVKCSRMLLANHKCTWVFPATDKIANAVRCLHGKTMFFSDKLAIYGDSIHHSSSKLKHSSALNRRSLVSGLEWCRSASALVSMTRNEAIITTGGDASYPVFSNYKSHVNLHVWQAVELNWLWSPVMNMLLVLHKCMGDLYSERVSHLGSRDPHYCHKIFCWP